MVPTQLQMVRHLQHNTYILPQHNSFQLPEQRKALLSHRMCFNHRGKEYRWLQSKKLPVWSPETIQNILYGEFVLGSSSSKES
jgi:hypothetical protein